eukprot:COSAG01_NODE_61468_length_289_cov_1.078947_1_plen_42_part_10
MGMCHAAGGGGGGNHAHFPIIIVSYPADFIISPSVSSLRGNP